WSWARLADVCTSITDGDHQPPPKETSGVPFLVIGNVRHGKAEFKDCRYVSTEYYNSLDIIRRPKVGDILYTLVGSFGIPILITDRREFCVQRHIGILRPAGEMHKPYLLLALCSSLIFNQALNCATGIAQKTIPLSGLRNFLLPVPPVDEQKRITAET